MSAGKWRGWLMAAILVAGVSCGAAPGAAVTVLPASATVPPTPEVTQVPPTLAPATEASVSTPTQALPTPAPTLTPLAVGFVPVPGRPSLLEFYEEGCGPCVIMQTVVHDLHVEYGERVTFASAEIEDPASRGLMKLYRARGAPFIVLLSKDGQTAHRIYGVVEASELRQWLDRLLQ